MALRRRGVGLLAVSSKVYKESRLGNESRSYYTITLIRAYPRRKKLPDIRNCKTTIALKKILNHRITGAAVSKVGFSDQGPQWRVMRGQPEDMGSPLHKRTPTKEGWVFLEKHDGANFHIEIMMNRVSCEDCQPEIF
ncbi:uncharacterized protein LOC117652977 [Thrips palmi]|uniref:Uncharacterized protein LOC117652977 n=1 Tax=Thrips palmi TaxID=161013 RepID=A0A6P9A9Y8_THRPL|nr:uncharacterized protein LOC117652977 [Thrips palmi]